MKIKQLHMRNFRGIADLSISFEPRITVLVGRNGAGKSSVLDCLAVLLHGFFCGLAGNLQGRRRFAESDISVGETETANALTIGEPDITWSLATDRALPGRRPKDALGELRAAVAAVRLGAGGGELPLAVSYPVDRAVVGLPPLGRPRRAFQREDAFDQALAEGARDFHLFFEWFREREDLENEQRARQREYRDPQLEAVRRAIMAFMPGFEDVRIERMAPARLMLKKRGTDLNVNQLSDGEKCLLALVGDLARRLALANSTQEDCLQGQGWVLIDELELHLHPAWQRTVAANLCRVFPKCQFIVTTHSPQVLSAVPTRSVVLLDDGRVAAPAAGTEGRDSNAILAEVMGVPERPLEIQQEVHRVAELIDQERLPEARQAIDNLARTLTDQDAEIVRLRSLVTFLGEPR